MPKYHSRIEIPYARKNLIIEIEETGRSFEEGPSPKVEKLVDELVDKLNTGRDFDPGLLIDLIDHSTVKKVRTILGRKQIELEKLPEKESAIISGKNVNMQDLAVFTTEGHKYEEGSLQKAKLRFFEFVREHILS